MTVHRLRPAQVSGRHRCALVSIRLSWEGRIILLEGYGRGLLPSSHLCPRAAGGPGHVGTPACSFARGEGGILLMFDMICNCAPCSHLKVYIGGFCVSLCLSKPNNFRTSYHLVLAQ